LGGRDQKDAIQAGAVSGGFGRGEVAEVDRIEGAAQDAHPHG
jgi:hypothetical protein